MSTERIQALEERLQEAEIKLAFLEKEAGESQDTSRLLHARLRDLEEALRALRQSLTGDSGGGNSDEGES